MMLYFLRILASSCLLLILVTSVSFANQDNVALGSDGTVYRTVVGPQGDFFNQETRPDSPVMVLEVTRPDGAREHLLVPSTDDASGDVESRAALIFDETSQTLFLVWEVRLSGIHPVLNLISFDGTNWGSPQMISRDPFALKGVPRLAITRDDFELPDRQTEGGIRVVQRTIIHALWWEDGTSTEILYKPIILLDGSFVGSDAAPFHMNILSPSVEGNAPSGGGMDQSLIHSPTIAVGKEHRSLVIGFVDSQTDEVLTSEITILPGEVSRLADTARAHIVDASTNFPSWNQLADLARAHIVDANARLNRENLLVLADKLQAFLRSRPGMPPADPVIFADLARAHIVDASVTLFGPEDMRLYENSEYSVQELNSEFQEPDGSTALLSHHLVFQTLSRRPAPTVGGEVTEVFLSSSGKDITIVWEGEDSLTYIESRQGSWGPVHTLPLSEGLSREQGYAILKQRSRNR